MVKRCLAMAKEAKWAIEDMRPDFNVVTPYLINSSCIIICNFQLVFEEVKVSLEPTPF